MAALAAIGTFIGKIAPLISGAGTIAGGAIAAQGQKAQAKAQQQALDYQAKQLDNKAKEEQAAAQREAFQHRKEKEFALSALQARGAASGFATDDPTAMQIGSEIEEHGTLQEQMAQFGGTSRRVGLEDEARGRRAQGSAIVQGASYGAAGTILGGLAQGFSRFAQYSPPPRSSSFRYG